ncbi:signal peptidase I [Lamprobacter modestohalophilus]|uniref:Signal peptidase I n=1 Tax=Lamprobacter modestohalophilus TaxID=1064514 RepID=A0A9X0WDQ0_9GAMM|nr:signal peptidase I [Lamprobacter modestohalophilus]MBK1621531.1 signal peptidase I [Lamprobacter modestohalophilus]
MSMRRNTPRHRQPWDRFLLKALVVLTLILVIGSLLCGRFRLGLDDQDALCLPPYRWYLIDTWDRQPQPGQLVAFAATEAMVPYFTVGQTVIKRVVGVAGDRVAVDAAGTSINGVVRPNSDPALATTLKQPVTTFDRAEFEVPPGHLWVMGDTRDSFDGRYWGALPIEQVQGRAYALF